MISRKYVYKNVSISEPIDVNSDFELIPNFDLFPEATQQNEKNLVGLK